MWSEWKCVRHAANRRQRDPPQHEVLGGLRAGLDDVELTAGEHYHGRLRSALLLGSGAEEPPDRDAHRIVGERRRVDCGGLRLCTPVENGFLNARREQSRCSNGRGDYEDRAAATDGRPGDRA